MIYFYVTLGLLIAFVLWIARPNPPCPICKCGMWADPERAQFRCPECGMVKEMFK